MIRKDVICLIIGYAFGSFLTAAAVARRRGMSIFKAGSGNPGMANAMRLFGFGPGMAVLAGDILKTVAAWIVTGLMFGWSSAVTALTTVGAVLGHDFPFWHRFRGGKGVAVMCSGIVLMAPGWGFGALAAGAAVVILSHYLCLGAVAIPTLYIAPAWHFGSAVSGVCVMVLTGLAVLANAKSLKALAHREEPQVDVIGLIREKSKNKK